MVSNDRAGSIPARGTKSERETERERSFTALFYFALAQRFIRVFLALTQRSIRVFLALKQYSNSPFQRAFFQYLRNYSYNTIEFFGYTHFFKGNNGFEYISMLPANITDDTTIMNNNII